MAEDGEGDRSTGGRRSRTDLTQGSVFSHLIRFIVPMSFGITAMMAVGLIDAFWLGRLSTEALAAVSFAVPVSFAVFAIFIGLSSGCVAAVARVVSSGDHDRIARLATDGVLLSLTVSIVAAVIGTVATRPLFVFIGAEGATLEQAVGYMQIWFLGLVFVSAPVIAGAILRAIGQAVLPSALMIVSAAVNMILDPLMIFGLGPFPRLEVAGAAYATVIANAVSATLVLGFMIFRERLLTLAPVAWSVLARHWREIARVGIPAAGSNAINPISLTFVIAALATFAAASDEAVAGFGAASRIEMFAIIPMFALSAAMAPVTGQNLGGGRIDRVREAFRSGFLIAVGWGLVTAAALALLAPLLAAGFNEDPDTRAAMRLYLWIIPVTNWGYGVVIAASAGFNGLSRPMPALAMTVFRSLILMAGGCWLGGYLMGAPGVFLGVAAANLIGGVFAGGWTLFTAFPPRRTEPAPAE
ncbi:MAG: MATE family efflux transporter [Maricaulaceae bacterium]|jgi:putative MATE family efflux protein